MVPQGKLNLKDLLQAESEVLARLHGEIASESGDTKARFVSHSSSGHTSTGARVEDLDSTKKS